MKCIKEVFPAVAMLAVFAGCSVQAPEVRVTGERTALEREVLGTYHEMEEDTWMVASSRSAGQGKPVQMSAEKKEVLDALQQQKFNKDDIDQFKESGWVGESNQGLLEIRSLESIRDDEDRIRLIREIVGEENGDREIIMNRVIELNESLKRAERDEVMRIFSKMYQENSRPGTWIQNSDGVWRKK